MMAVCVLMFLTSLIASFSRVYVVVMRFLLMQRGKYGRILSCVNISLSGLAILQRIHFPQCINLLALLQSSLATKQRVAEMNVVLGDVQQTCVRAYKKLSFSGDNI